MQLAKSGKQPKAAHDIAVETSARTRGILPPRERPREEVWADEGIEQLAGKGWKDMEAERQTQRMQQINARVQEAFKTSKVSVLIYQSLSNCI